jgi:hypothetical protein
MFDEFRADMSVERGCVVWRGGLTGTLDGIVEDLGSLFNTFSSFEGDVKG